MILGASCDCCGAVIRKGVKDEIAFSEQRKESAFVYGILRQSSLRLYIHSGRAALRYPDRIRDGARLLHLSSFVLIAVFFEKRLFHRNATEIIRK